MVSLLTMKLSVSKLMTGKHFHEVVTLGKRNAPDRGVVKANIYIPRLISILRNEIIVPTGDEAEKVYI